VNDLTYREAVDNLKRRLGNHFAISMLIILNKIPDELEAALQSFDIATTEAIELLEGSDKADDPQICALVLRLRNQAQW